MLSCWVGNLFFSILEMPSVLPFWDSYSCKYASMFPTGFTRVPSESGRNKDFMFFMLRVSCSDEMSKENASVGLVFEGVFPFSCCFLLSFCFGKVSQPQFFFLLSLLPQAGFPYDVQTSLSLTSSCNKIRSLSSPCRLWYQICAYY